METESPTGPADGSRRTGRQTACTRGPQGRRRRIVEMIAHVVLFKPKHELTTAQRQTVIDDLKAAAAGIPTVRSLRVGKRLRHGMPGYEQVMREDFEYVVVIEFDDADGLKAYLAHPKHAAIGAHFMQAAAAALAYDYEMEDWKST
jgi:hypothetical protein